MSSGVRGVGLAGPGLPRRSVRSVSSAVLPVGGRVGGCVSVGGVDQRPLSLPLQVLRRCDRLQDLRLAAAHRRSVTGSTGDNYNRYQSDNQSNLIFLPVWSRLRPS